jgi:uncharacterized membrane protein
MASRAVLGWLVALGGLALAALSLGRPRVLRAALTINRQPEEVYRVWREYGPLAHSPENVRLMPAPGGRGTEVRVEMPYRLPFAPNVQAELHKLKRVLEVG